MFQPSLKHGVRVPEHRELSLSSLKRSLRRWLFSGEALRNVVPVGPFTSFATLSQRNYDTLSLHLSLPPQLPNRHQTIAWYKPVLGKTIKDKRQGNKQWTAHLTNLPDSARNRIQRKVFKNGANEPPFALLLILEQSFSLETPTEANPSSLSLNTGRDISQAAQSQPLIP